MMARQRRIMRRGYHLTARGFLVIAKVSGYGIRFLLGNVALALRAPHRELQARPADDDQASMPMAKTIPTMMRNDVLTGSR